MDRMTRNFNKKASEHKGSLVEKKVVVSREQDLKSNYVFKVTHDSEDRGGVRMIGIEDPFGKKSFSDVNRFKMYQI